MQAIVDMPTLKKALASAKPALTRRGSGLLAITGARLEARPDDTITVTATDLDLGITITIPGAVTEPGITLVPFAALAETVKTGKGDLALEDDGDELVATNGAVRRIRKLPIEDYPRLPGEPDGARMLLDIAALATVLPAASKDDTRPILTGVFFDGNVIVATDSYRLHLVRFPEAVAWPKVLVPARSLVAPVKFNGTTSIVFGERDARLQAGNVAWSTRLIEGDFPNYRQLLPNDYPNLAIFDRAAAIAAIKPFVAFTKGTSTPVRFTFHADRVECRAVIQDEGEMAGSFPAEYIGADELTIGLNPAFALDALAVGVGDEVHLSSLDSLKPVTFTDGTPGPWQSLRLLMPVRIS
jgi:DNA polymerase-3 subunit beta